jgi:DNA-binding winged helix-turn-helix (wHTH) protein
MDILLVVSRSDDFIHMLSGCPLTEGRTVLPVASVAAALVILEATPLPAVVVDLATVEPVAAAELIGLQQTTVVMVPDCADRSQAGTSCLCLSDGGKAKAPSVTSCQVRIGSLLVNRQEWRVELGETEIALSGREFRLLDYIARHPDQVKSREAIITEVWGTDFHGTDRVVDVCLSRLRRQLFDRSDCPVTVRAVPGVGYKLIRKPSATSRPLPHPQQRPSAALTGTEA